MKNLSLLALLLLTCSLLQAQTPEEYLRQQEQIKRANIMKQLDSGVYYMDNGQHELADAKFKYVLNNIKGVPSTLTYYFGKNSFMLGQYKQSVDWLNKYIQLKGTNGQYSQEAASMLHKAEAELLTQQAQQLRAAAEKEKEEKQQQVLSSNYDIDCGPTGKVICPVCHGAHVIIKKGTFGDEYKTCPYCNDHGILTCDEYNMLVKGQLKPKF